MSLLLLLQKNNKTSDFERFYCTEQSTGVIRKQSSVFCIPLFLLSADLPLAAAATSVKN